MLLDDSCHGYQVTEYVAEIMSPLINDDGDDDDNDDTKLKSVYQWK